MKVNRFITVLIIVILAVFTASAKSDSRVSFSGTERFDPFGVFGMVYGEFLPSEMTVLCPGNEPTGDPLQPCPTGSRTHIRGSKWKSQYFADDPNMSGWFYIEGNANLDANFTGPQWGSFTLVMDDGGTITGSFQGVRYKENNYWVTPLHVTGKITGGTNDGAKMVGTDEIVSFFPIPIAYTGSVAGFLMNVP